MKANSSNSRDALAALVSAVAAVAVFTLTAGPALARAASGMAAPGHDLPVQAQGPGSGSASLWGVAVIAALLAATVAFGLIGWHYDRRRVALSQNRSPETAAGGASAASQRASETAANGPAAAKPLPTRTLSAARARRAPTDEHAGVVGDRHHPPMI
jgi:hypothetical protein